VRVGGEVGGAGRQGYGGRREPRVDLEETADRRRRSLAHRYAYALEPLLQPLAVDAFETHDDSVGAREASDQRIRAVLPGDWGAKASENMKLTKDVVTALSLPPGKNDHFEWGKALPGFAVRLRGKTKTWVVQFRIGAQQRRESLGDVRKVTLEDARKIARQRFAQVELGVDPAAERARARAATLSLAIVSSRYLE